VRLGRHLLALCAGFAIVWSLVLAYFFLFAGMSAGPAGGSVSAGILWMLGWLSLPLAAIGWTSAGVATLLRRNERRVWRQSGFSEDVYDLMVRMRGAGSRLAILQYLDAPRHRMELSQLSGLDWKEVDRETGLLERYGLISVYAESGSVKLYKLTEQGRMLLKLMKELSKKG
jgi:hypothetical protein